MKSSTHRWRVWSDFAGLLAIALLLASGCSKSTPFEIDGTRQSVVITHRPIVVGADSRWQPAPDGIGIELQHFGTLRIRVGETSDEPLTIRFVPIGSTKRFHALAAWDGEPLQPKPSPLTELVIPSSRLSPGVHVLEIRRLSELDLPRTRGRHFRWERIVIERDGYRTVFDRESHQEISQVGEFLEFGGTGSRKVKRSGLLFLGPARGEIHLRDARLRAANRAGKGTYLWTAVAENLDSDRPGAEPARLRVTSEGGANLEYALIPGTTQRLEIPVDSDSATIRIEAQDPAGLRVLIGEPYLSEASADLPPIVLITLDTTRRDALTPYGAPAGYTPRLQELAGTSTIYDAAYATSPWTLPSHASIFSGLLPSRHGAGVSEADLAPDIDTLGEALAREGYFNGGFAGGHLMSYRYGIGQGFQVYRDPDEFETSGDRLTSYVEDFLDENSNRPFFLFVNYFDAHWRYEPPDDLAGRYRLDELAADLASEPVWQEAFGGDWKAWGRLYKSEEEISRAARAYLEAAYAAEISGLDRHVGRVLDSLRQHGRFDDALIVVVADHGELLGEDGRFVGHGYRLSDELVQIPLIVKWPHQSRGERVGHLASQIDLFPTILNVARRNDPGPAPEGPSATDLRSLPRTSWTLAEEHAAAVHPLEGKRLLAKHLFRVQKETFRQIVWKGGEECSRRGVDGWRIETCPEDGAALQRQLESWLVTRTDPGSSALDEESAEALRALGYL